MSYYMIEMGSVDELCHRFASRFVPMKSPGGQSAAQPKGHATIQAGGETLEEANEIATRWQIFFLVNCWVDELGIWPVHGPFMGLQSKKRNGGRPRLLETVIHRLGPGGLLLNKEYGYMGDPKMDGL